MDQAAIEQNKDKMDLAPNVAFVQKHIVAYRNGLDKLLARRVSDQSRSFADRVVFDNLEGIVDPQLHPEALRHLIAVMPDPLLRLSRLEKVQYVNSVPVPRFDVDGNFSGEPEWVNYATFPRAMDHPSRILVGLSNGTGIYPTPIPQTVSAHDEAVMLYQTHVFMHEFFHTIDYPRRDVGKRRSVLLSDGGKEFTFQDFWDGFETLALSPDRRFVSRYAATYADKLNAAVKLADPKRFDTALGEQICESFVGYLLGIVSNDDAAVDFRLAHPQEYSLMDSLCRSDVVNGD